MEKIILGDRRTFEFHEGEDSSAIDIADYDYMPVPPFTENINGKESTCKEVLMTLLVDNSVVLTSIDTGRHYLWLDLAELAEGDEIVDLLATNTH